ncbi:MAG: DUF5801 repeats-in-toxin domain-containing protein, partial [Pseudomonadota bacterium]
MASNTIILSQPDSETIINHEVPTDSSARLNYEAEDIEGLSLGSNGELVITFENGGQVNISNFADFADAGNLLYLNDGTLIDASILTTAPLQPEALNTIETAAGTPETRTIAKPEAGTTQEVTVEEGFNYVCDFDPQNAAHVEIKDGQMVLTFADGSQVVINNYSETVAGQLPEGLVVAQAEEEAIVEEQITEVTDVIETPAEEDLVAAVEETEGEGETTTTIPARETSAKEVANIEPAAGEQASAEELALAQELANIEPAAGEGGSAGNSGFGFNSSPVEVSFNAPPAIGPIDPTALQYNAPQFIPEQLLEPEIDGTPSMGSVSVTLDETNLSPSGSIGTSGPIGIDFGSDGPGSVLPNGVFSATCEVNNGVLSSGGVPVEVTQTQDGYVGTINGGTPVFTFTVDVETGEYSYEQVLPFDHADPANDNEEICLNFGVVATDGDGDAVTTNVQINILDDAPIVESQIDANVDESNPNSQGNLTVSGQFSATPGQDVNATYGGTDTFNATGSVAGGTLSSNGVPIQVEFNDTTNTYVGTAGTAVVFELEIDPQTGEFTYTQYAPLDHADGNDPDDVITLEFGANITDFDGDSAEGVITINVADDAPVTEGSSASVDETDGAGTNATGSVFIDFNYDSNGTVVGNDTFTSSETTLTAGGLPVTVNYDQATNTYTGSTTEGDVFTLELQDNGDYEFTLLAPLDHADTTDPDDALTLSFGYDAVDGDADAASGTIEITVNDDGPSRTNITDTVDETDLANGVVATGTFTPDYGFDGEGSFELGGGFDSRGSQLNGALTSNGVPVIVDLDPITNSYVGVAGNETVFTLSLDNNGEYRFELLKPLDHADPNDPNDIIELGFGVITTDADRDTRGSTITILVKDDVPTIEDSSGDVDESNFDQGPLEYRDVVDTNFGVEVGNVSADGNTSSSTPLFSNGVPVTITQNGNTYTGAANGVTIFTLVIDSQTGEYTYTQTQPLDHPDTNNPDDVISIDFGVQLTSVDGDEDTGTITINIADDGPVANDDINGAEEGQLITGDVVANDELSEDEINTVTNVNFDGTDFVIPANGSQTITGNFGTLTINSDGTYQYVTNSNDPDGVDQFTYTLTDRDGDSDTAQLSITVTPDGQPVAVSEELAVDETNLTPGPMIFNGNLDVDFGIDGAGTVTPNGNFSPAGSLKDGTFTSNDQTINVTLNGNTYTGFTSTEDIFTLVINEDGTYTFTLLNHIDHADATDPNDLILLEFGITAADADNDTTDGTITIQIFDDAPVAYDDGQTTLDESQTVTGNVTDNDELSEDKPNNVVEVIFNGQSTLVTAGTAATITGNFGVLTISQDGSYSYKANDDNPEGIDEFTYVLQDFDGDHDTAEISFNVNPLNDKPEIIKPAKEVVDETNLDQGDLVDTGTIQANFFGDGPGTIQGNNSFNSSVPLTSGGVAVVVTYANGVYTGSANGTEIFRLEIETDGDYTYTQSGVLDHPNTNNPDDAITLNFGIEARDADGDIASTTLDVVVKDDGPVIHSKAKPIDESDADANGIIEYSHKLSHDYGEDGPGSIDPNGTFEAKYQVGGQNQQLTSDGNPITVTQTADGYVGTAGGETVFTLVVKNDGNYTYTQEKPVDHPDAHDADDVIWLKFGVTITDNDGDTDDAMIIVDLHDDGPVARDDHASVKETKTVAGDVIANDDYGYDGAGRVMKVDGTTVSVNG